MHFLLNLPTPLSFLLVAFVAVATALAGLTVVHRFIPAESLKENQEVAAVIFSAFGWVYAVVVAFAVFVTWTGYDQAKQNLELEVSSVLDVFYSASAFREPLASTIRQAMIKYVSRVEQDELSHMSSENLVFVSSGPLRELVKIMDRVEESSLPNRVVYSESRQKMDDLARYRRLRIFSGSNTVPPVLWLVLLSGAVVTVVCTYFFSTPYPWVQHTMTAALSLMLSLVLFLVFVLDHPFTGRSRLSDAPLERALVIMGEHGSR
ncbi:MAG: DUF4239 domain-containing protein [Verrucomicrobia bacterium]|nr:DUF4239 domain-containing protein [Verrucomicrobiota bacterium]